MMLRRVANVVAGGVSRALGATAPAASAALSKQARHKPLQPFRWPNEKVMRKHMRNVLRPYEIKNDVDTVNGAFGLVVKRGGHITERQLENALLALKQKYRMDKHYIVTVRDEHQLLPVTRRPQGARMGKGVGDTVQWVMKVRAGTVLFDVECRQKDMLDRAHANKFFQPIQHMLGVPTYAVLGGLVTDLDDIDYASAHAYMDGNWCRRVQDAYPDIAMNKAYDHAAKRVDDAPIYNPKRPTRHWWPVYSGKDYPHRQVQYNRYLSR